ncbi:MAG TPA: phosphotransferase [Candidatus Dormibacteraeota bacterium]
MRLLAKGRAADVYDLGDGTVLRRYREPWDTGREADIMRRLEAAGYPVPHVVSADGDDLVMERIQGVTMLEDLARRPWRLVSHANLLATLMRRLHAIQADGGSILHGDFHPLNVLLTARGPVVIDWTAARVGPWPYDVAMTWVIMATSVPDDSGWQRALATAGQSYFTRRFLRHFELEPVRAVLPEVGRLRLRDPHVTAREAARVRRLAGLVPEPEEFQ